MLLNQIRSQLTDLERGIQGLVVMSSDLEEIFTCIYDARVPSSWEKVRTRKSCALHSLFIQYKLLNFIIQRY